MHFVHFVRLAGLPAPPCRQHPEMLRLSASGLGCIRGSRSVFSDINLELSSGGALALVGPNGSGKSSLLRLIAGLLRPSAGQIELAGGDAERTIGEQAHYLGHLDALKPSLTVAENLGFWAGYLGDRAGSSDEALAAVGLGSLGDLPAAYLSAGQRRRLSLGRLLAVPRPVWLLDEPTSGLDTGGQERLAELMRQHLGTGGMVVAATHGPLGIEAKELRLGGSP
jgi:heme exporter protein A